jgi:hypothetical protein
MVTRPGSEPLSMLSCVWVNETSAVQYVGVVSSSTASSADADRAAARDFIWARTIHRLPFHLPQLATISFEPTESQVGPLIYCSNCHYHRTSPLAITGAGPDG